MSFSRYAQIRWLAIFLGPWLIIFFLTRLVLLASHFGDVNTTLFGVLGIFGLGLVYDLSFLSYAALPLALFLALCPAMFWQRPWHHALLRSLIGFSLFVMLFTAVAEWIFWDEFGVRFNFIAVDYLVYSNEVINNILESYPVYPLLAMLVVISAVGGVVLGKVMTDSRSTAFVAARARVTVCGRSPVVSARDSRPWGRIHRWWRKHCAARTCGQRTFPVFRSVPQHELDYYQLYATLPDEDLGGLLRRKWPNPMSAS
jgi:hypothetical protein